jgi:hypothetical protein
MATITATINISSDISSYPTSISKTMTMKKAGSCNGLEETLGLKTKKFTSTTAAEIATAADLTNAQAHKLYVRNASTDKANFFYVSYHATDATATDAETIGKLYGGDWMLMPYNAATDINVASSTTEVQYLEYMVFADGIVTAIG